MNRAFSGKLWPSSWNGTVVSHRVHVLKEQEGGLPGVRTRPYGGKRRMDQGVHIIPADSGFRHNYQLSGNILSRRLVDMDIHISIQIDAATPPENYHKGGTFRQVMEFGPWWNPCCEQGEVSHSTAADIACAGDNDTPENGSATIPCPQVVAAPRVASSLKDSARRPTQPC